MSSTVAVAGRMRGALGSYALPGAMLLGAVVVLGGIAWLSQRVGHEATRPEPPAFVNPIPAPASKRYIVKQTNGTTLSLVEESSKDPANAPEVQLALGADRPVEVLQEFAAADLRAGDWVAVIGIPNAVRNFAIHALVVVPGGAKRPDGLARSAAGFAGNESTSSAGDTVILSGPIADVTATAFVITGGTSPVRIDLTPRPPLYRIERASGSDIHSGDLIAVTGSVQDAHSPVLARASSDRK